MLTPLGAANSRMKDYYDLWALPRNPEIGADQLDAAISATFARRGTAIPHERPPGLSAEMAGDEARRRQWTAYAGSLELEGVDPASITDAVWKLVGPSCKRLTAPA